MKTLRRLTATITSSFDWMAKQIENHDALVESAIAEVQETSARARVQLKKVQSDGKAVRTRLKELHVAEQTWTERATAIAQENEAKALECLRRKKRIAQEIGLLESEEREHARVEKQLIDDLQKVEERLRNLRSQRNLMRTRESRAQALGVVYEPSSNIISEIDSIFERWDTKVTHCELKADCALSGEDQFEREFENADEEGELRAELAALIGENSQKQSG